MTVSTRIRVGFLVMAVSAGSLTTASAAVITFSDRTAWEAAVGTPSWTVDFSGFATDTSFGGGIPLDVGPFSLVGTASSVPGFEGRNIVDVAPFELFTDIDGTPYARVYTQFFTGVDDATADLTLDTGVSAWGADFRIAPTAGFGLAFDLFSDSGAFLMSHFFSPIDSGGPAAFLGFSTTAGERIGRIHMYDTGFAIDRIGLDNIAGVEPTVVPPTPVPEPTLLLLLAAGLVGLNVARRRSMGRGAKRSKKSIVVS